MSECCVNRVRVGEKAPDFEAGGYFKKAFSKFRLSNYAGKKWVLLFFYPGDFTYV